MDDATNDRSLPSLIVGSCVTSRQHGARLACIPVTMLELATSVIHSDRFLRHSGRRRTWRSVARMPSSHCHSMTWSRGCPCPARRVSPATAYARVHDTWNTSLYWRPWFSGHPWCLSCMSHGWIHAIACRVLERLRCIFVRYSLSLPTGSIPLASTLPADVRHDWSLKDGRMAYHLPRRETLRATLTADGCSLQQAVPGWIWARSPGPSRALVSRPSSRSKRTSRRRASYCLPTARCGWSRRRSRTSQ